MTRIKTQQDYTDTILTHIQATNPCTLRSVTSWAASQGYGGSKMVQAIHTLKTEGIIYTDTEELDGGLVTIVNLA